MTIMANAEHVLTAYRLWLDAQGYSTTTRRLLFGVVANLTSTLEVEPRSITAAHVETYLRRDLAARTRKGYLWSLRTFAAWAGIPDPTEGIRRPRIPHAVPRPVAEGDLLEIIASATPLERAYLLLGAYCGLRSFETAKVAASDFEGAGANLALRVLGKGGRVDLVPVARVVDLETRPWRLQAGGGRLFPGATANSVQCAVLRASERVGLRITSHQLRHRYGTALYAASHDLLVTQRLMRHASPTTTAGYALVLDEVGARLVDALPAPAPRISRTG